MKSKTPQAWRTRFYLITRILFQLAAFTFLIGSTLLPSTQGLGSNPPSAPAHPVYLPAVFRFINLSPAGTPQVNAPYFQDQIHFSEGAIFWFGQVTPSKNYSDVRVGYTDSKLWIYVATFDRRLWYKANPTPGDLTNWDSTSVYLNVNGNVVRLDSELNWWEPRDGSAYQASYQKNGSDWQPVSIPFTTISGWAGYPAPNDDGDDRGWTMAYNIPFASLGLSGPPAQGTTWDLGISVHDRDSAAGPALADQVWPEAMAPGETASWGKLRFGLPVYAPPANASVAGTTTIRNKVNGAVVPDGMVGGSSVCGGNLDYWTAWGQKNYANAGQVNVQNEVDISDWPCFSKYYLTFPLDSLPAGKTILSATLTMHSVGNAGGGQYGTPPTSLIQVMTVGSDWSMTTLNWNNAPLALENVSRAWVEPVQNWQPGQPFPTHSWDLSYAVSQAYLNRQPLRLVLYSADEGYNTGRYFASSEAGEADRPALEINWGN